MSTGTEHYMGPNSEGDFRRMNGRQLLDWGKTAIETLMHWGGTSANWAPFMKLFSEFEHLETTGGLYGDPLNCLRACCEHLAGWLQEGE